MSRVRMVSAREIVGKRIVAFRPGSYKSGAGVFATTMHDPAIDLDDGTTLYFITEEDPDGGEYGVHVGRTRPRSRTKKESES